MMDPHDPERRCDPDDAHDRRMDDRPRRVDPDQLLKHFGTGWSTLPSGAR